MQTIDIAPMGHYLTGIQKGSFAWTRELPELVDNAIDAGAKNVHMWFWVQNHGNLTGFKISDDGKGADDLRAVMKLGEHKPHKTTVSGQYGAGGSTAIIKLSNSCRIYTKRKGQKAEMARFDASEIIRSGEWKMAHQRNVHCDELIGPTGLTIDVDQVFPKRRWSESGSESVRSELAWRFGPALLSGVRIRITENRNSEIKEFDLLPESMPSLCDRKEGLIKLPQGTISYIAGVMDGEDISRAGCYYIYGMKVAESKTKAPLMGMDADRFFLYATFSRGFDISLNKDEILDEDGTIAERLHEECKDLIQNAHQLGLDLELQALELAVQDTMTDLFELGTEIKEKRKPKQSDQTVTSEPKGATRHPSGDSQSGSHSIMQRMREFKALRMRIKNMGSGSAMVKIEPEAFFGYQSLTITLNADHPYIEQNRTEALATKGKSLVPNVLYEMLKFWETSDLPSAIQQKLEGMGVNADDEWEKKVSKIFEIIAATPKA